MTKEKTESKEAIRQQLRISKEIIDGLKTLVACNGKELYSLGEYYSMEDTHSYKSVVSDLENEAFLLDYLETVLGALERTIYEVMEDKQ